MNSLSGFIRILSFAIEYRKFNFLKDGSTNNIDYWKEALEPVAQGTKIAVDIVQMYATLKTGGAADDLTGGLTNADKFVDTIEGVANVVGGAEQTNYSSKACYYENSLVNIFVLVRIAQLFLGRLIKFWK